MIFCFKFRSLVNFSPVYKSTQEHRSASQLIQEPLVLLPCASSLDKPGNCNYLKGVYTKKPAEERSAIGAMGGKGKRKGSQKDLRVLAGHPSRLIVRKPVRFFETWNVEGFHQHDRKFGA